MVAFIPTCNLERDSAAAQVSVVGGGSFVGVDDGSGTGV